MMKRKDGLKRMPNGVQYVCSICKKSFGNRQPDCKRHMWSVHGINDPVPDLKNMPDDVMRQWKMKGI